jgi:hypothetical protein
MNCAMSSPKSLRVLLFLKLLYYRENFPAFRLKWMSVSPNALA